MVRRIFVAFALVTFTGFSLPAEEAAKIVDVKKIWDQAPHNAFTDLVRFNDRWFCVFREGQGHVSPDGSLRVITSVDGETWESAALIRSPDSDLRDAKITVTPDGQLMLCGAEALHDTSFTTHQSVAWFSKDGRTWSDPQEIGDPDFWLWRVTWHNNKAYGIGYACGKEESVRLYSSTDGKSFDTLVERLLDVGYPNETSIVFVDDTAWCLLRRDGNPSSGLLGMAKSPYTSWNWKDLKTKIGGPHMIRLPDGRFIAAVRLYDPGVRTSLCWIDPEAGTLSEFLALPSGGDTSYAGLVLHDDLLWVSYYSSHEDRTSIYLAKVQIAPASETTAPGSADKETIRDIGSQRELFVDDYLIDQHRGLEFTMHRPVARESVMVCDEPWEGNTSAYFTLFPDGDRFRMYYRGSHFDEATKKAAHPEFTCLAESSDGIHWEKPPLELFEFNGSKHNNIVWSGEDTHNFTPFKDTNPDCQDDARYKALGGSSVGWGGRGLRAYSSPDGIHWSLMSEDGVLTNGDFDSQNLAFWHPQRQCYVTFYRKGRDGVRDIMTATSTDFIHWTEPIFLDYGDAPKEHLYTNAIGLYARAPQIFLGFPTRFQPDHEQVEPILMTSRDGLRFQRWPEPMIPITAPQDRDGNRSNYMTSGLLQLPGQDGELSVYATEAYYTGPGSRVRRFTFRNDGFVSLHAGSDAGEMLTRPLRFQGSSLVVNFSASAAGSVKIEIQNLMGKPFPGFTLADCQPLEGDSVEAPVKWAGGSVEALTGMPIRLRFVLKEADLYSLKFDPNR